MDCLSTGAKYILIFFNALVAIFGIVLIAIGGVVIANEDKGLDSFTDFSVGAFTVSVGVIILLIAGFGLFGAIKENSCLLTTYAAILILIFIIQVTLGALAFIQLKNDDNKLDNNIRDIVRRVFNNGDFEVIDDIQQWFECCGVDSPDYWTNEAGQQNCPDSCFEDKDRSKSMYQEGCSKAFKDVMTKYITVIGIVGIVFAVIELLGAIFAFVVRNNIAPY